MRNFTVQLSVSQTVEYEKTVEVQANSAAEARAKVEQEIEDGEHLRDGVEHAGWKAAAYETSDPQIIEVEEDA